MLSFSVHGQVEVSGIVVNENGEALIGATIHDKGSDVGTITNIDGTFRFISNADSLVVMYTGFVSKTIPINKNGVHKIILVQAFKIYRGITPVEINAKNILTEKENITTLPKIITEITTPANINEVLNTVPGIHMQSGGFNTNKLSIRGIGSTAQFATSDVKTFYNNIPMHNSIGESAIEDIGLHMADRIEVIKGTTGSEYEAGYGGAIIIKNKNIRSEEKTEVASHNTFGKWGHFTTQNQINIGRTNKINSHNLAIYHSFITDDGYRDNNQFKRNNFTLNYTVNKAGKLKLTALINRVDLKAFIPSSLNRDDFENQPSKAAFTWNSAKGNEDYNRTLVGINLDYEFDFKSSMSHTAYGQLFESSELRPFNTIDESNTNFGLKGKFQYNRPGYSEVYTVGYRIQQEDYDFDLFETNTDTKGSQFANGNEQRSIYELYATMDAEINEKWAYKLGINSQYAKITADENKVLGKAFLLPEATFSYRPDNNSRIYIQGGKGINYFNPQQALLPDGTYNSDLLPTSAWNISIGSKGIFTNKLQYRGEIYYMWATDLITTERNETNQSINTNGGNANYSGLELALRYSLLGKLKNNKNLTINMQYNLMQNKYADFIDDENDYSKNTIPGAPTQTFSAIIAGNLNGWFLNMRYHYINSYFMRDDNSIKSDAYQLVNAMAGYKFEKGKWQIIPRVDLVNLFDTKYASMTLVNASSFGGNAPRYYYSGRPRNVMVSINLNYEL
jgi:iron complex outermembrane receptor protein